MATCEQMCPDGAPSATGTATLPLAVWAPPAPPLVWPAVFPERLAVEIQSTEGGRTLVACEELVSPGNKDRASTQRLFVVKCATHLARGVGVVVIDTVTSGQGNLHK